MNKEEVDYILAHLDKDKTVFEWGTDIALFSFQTL